MKTTIHQIAAAGALTVLSMSASAQQGKPMEELLKPWLDPSFTKATGTDSNVKELVATVTPQIQATVPAKLAAPVTKKRRGLVLTENTLGALHAPGAAGLLVLLREAGKKFGDAFEFTEVYSSQGLDAAALAKYDAVVLNSISQLRGGKGEEFYNHVLPEYVRNGGGLLATHGTALLMRETPGAEFNKLLGGFTTANPVHPAKRHGAPFPTRIDEPKNPLTAAFRGPVQEVNTQGQWLAGAKRMIMKMRYTAPAQLADELYTFNPQSNADGATRPILSIDSVKLNPNTGPLFPEGTSEFGYVLIWIKDYGRGRVYYTQFGHNFAVYSVPCIARSMLDGLQYAAGDLPAERTSK
jgi:uncharacterized protein